LKYFHEFIISSKVPRNVGFKGMAKTGSDYGNPIEGGKIEKDIYV